MNEFFSSLYCTGSRNICTGKTRDKPKPIFIAINEESPIFFCSENDNDPQTRPKAICVLAAVGPDAKDAIPALRLAIEDNQTSSAAKNALKKIKQ
jgi:hypothetical protein